MSQSIVATGHSVTAESAAAILRMDGNAIDAAVSALFTACIAEPALSSLGGGGFAMIHPHNEKPVLLDFFAHTPRKLKKEHEVSVRSFLCDFGSTQQEFHIGAGTSAVPGCVKGIFEMLDRFGTMPATDLIQPTLDVLKEGIAVTELPAKFIDMLSPIFMDPSARSVYESKSNPGTPVRAGEKLYFPEYIDLLESLAIEGPDLFYLGEVAKSIDEISKFAGGIVSYEDLKEYVVHLRKPIETTYRDHTVYLNPPPSIGGLLLAMGFDSLCGQQLHPFGSSKYIQTILRMMKTINELEEDSPSSEINLELQHDYFNLHRQHNLASRGTTHISIIDKHRNSVAMTVSNGEGCGTMIPGTQVMMNNMLGEKDLNPRGLADWIPDKRLSSFMAPSIAMRNNGDQIVIGSGGSNRIHTAIQQVLLNLIDHRMSVEEAVQAPRLHYHEGAAYAEDIFADEALIEPLKEFQNFTRFPERNVFFGGAHTIRSTQQSLEGCGDERRSGFCIQLP